MRYEATKPTAQFTLRYHSLVEWGGVTYDRLIALGYSPEYARSVQRRILRAKAV